MAARPGVFWRAITVTRVDFGVGNLTSIQNMLKKVGCDSVISSNPDDISKATKILLPGMGAFDNCMQRFNDSGLRSVVEVKAFSEKIPVLGICVGLQMFMRGSEEGVLPGLGWIKGDTIRFKQEQMGKENKIPHMGWLDVVQKKPSGLLKDLNESRFYFAHSYHVQVDDSGDELLGAHYGYDFTVAVERNNILGVQFHPEKSHRFGMKLLENFARHAV